VSPGGICGLSSFPNALLVREQGYTFADFLKSRSMNCGRDAAPERWQKAAM